MRIISLFATGALSVLLGACSTPPMFPPGTLKDVEANTFDVQTWKNQASRPSDTTFVPHKVELAGEIIRVLHKSSGMIILAEERPLATPLAANPTRIDPGRTPWFAITFNGSVNPRLLQTGNRLIVVGTTTQASTEMFGGAPRLLPHLNAQCLHIWNTEGAKNRYWLSPTGMVEDYPAEERTFCREDHAVDSSLSGTSQ